MTGMNIDAVRRIARELAAQARRLDAVRGQVERLVRQGAADWRGGDADRFTSDWNADHLPKVRDLVRRLDELAERANLNADEQDKASGGSSGSAEIWNPLKGDPTDPFDAAREAAAKGDRQFIGSEYYTGTDALADKGLASDDDISLSKIIELSKGNMDIASGKVEWSGAVASVDAEGKTDLGGGFTAQGEASAAFLAATAGASGSVAFKDGMIMASGKAEAEADLVKAEASGRIGNEYAAVTGVASAAVGARAAASGSISEEGLKAKVGANAFAGVEASATAQVDLGGVKPSVTGQVYAGVGAHANAEVEVTAKEVKVSVDVGAALGIGAGVSFDIDINPGEVADNVGHFIDNIWHW
jgi:uncharacterized protein YukE